MNIASKVQEIHHRWDQEEALFSFLTQEDRVYTELEIKTQTECLKRLNTAKKEWLGLLYYRSN